MSYPMGVITAGAFIIQKTVMFQEFTHATLVVKMTIMFRISTKELFREAVSKTGTQVILTLMLSILTMLAIFRTGDKGIIHPTSRNSKLGMTDHLDHSHMTRIMV